MPSPVNFFFRFAPFKSGVRDDDENKVGSLSLKAPLYLTGKADCVNGAEANQSNKWMDPVKKADVCCYGIMGFGVVGCRNGMDKWCKC